MSWRDYKDKDKKKTNALEANDNKINQQKYTPTKEDSKRLNSPEYKVKNTANDIIRRNNNDKSMWERVVEKAAVAPHFTSLLGRAGASSVSSGVKGIPIAALTEQSNTLNKRKDETAGGTAKNILKNAANAFRMVNDPVYRAKAMMNTEAKITTNILKDIERQKAKGDYDNESFLGKTATGIGTVYTNLLNGIKEAQPTTKFTNDAMVAAGQIKEKLTGKTKEEQAKEYLDEAIEKYKPIQENNEKIQKEAQQYGKAGQLATSAVQSVGQMLPSAAVSFITKNPNLRTSCNGS